MSNADDLRAANPWQPMSNPIDLAHLGKLGEECGELGAAIARCIIQGIDACEPVTGKPNRLWLEDEIADVLAGLHLVTQRFGLDEVRMQERCLKKMRHLQNWHAQLSDARQKP